MDERELRLECLRLALGGTNGDVLDEAKRFHKWITGHDRALLTEAENNRQGMFSNLNNLYGQSTAAQNGLNKDQG